MKKLSKKKVKGVKCPEEFDFFCPIAKTKTEFGETMYYLHVPDWLWRAMRWKYPRGMLRVHFKKEYFGGYSQKEKRQIEAKLREYMHSENYTRLRRRIDVEEKINKYLEETRKQNEKH